MGDKSKIEWTDATWNPFRAERGKWHCVKVSPGCKNCYAERLNHRFGGPKYTVGADINSLNRDVLTQPVRWRKPRMVFVCSMTDLFLGQHLHMDIAAVFGVMAASPRHTFQVLTKRPENMIRFFGYMALVVRENRELGGLSLDVWTECHWQALCRDDDRESIHMCSEEADRPWPLPNVWLGVSAEDQQRFDERIEYLEQLRAKMPNTVLWLSVEPMLGPIDISRYIALGGPLWVVVGGESGPNHRPIDADWVRDIRDQCTSAGVPLFFKQWGGLRPKGGGRELDGQEWSEYPVIQ